MPLSNALMNRLRVALGDPSSATEMETTINDLTDGGIATTDIDAGASGTAGTVDIFPATAARGRIRLSAANSTGDTITTITNASQAAARTYTIPDGGQTTGQFILNEGAWVFNESSADVDARFESNALANFLYLDASECLNGTLSIGAVAPTNPQALFAVLPPANATGVTANQNYHHTQMLPGGAVTIPAGTAAVVSSLNVHEPNVTATGTVTDAVTLRIVDAPTEGTRNQALWVDAGLTRLDGDSVLGALSLGAYAPTNPQAFFAVQPPANASGIVTNQSYFHQQVLPGGAVTIPAGTAPVVASVNLHEPNITATGTVTDACTLRIVDAPTEGTRNYAFWVDAGVARFDGTLQLGIAGSVTGVMTFQGSTSGVVTITCLAAAGTYSLTLPPDDGDAGEQLQTDGSGVLTWEAAGSLRAVKNVLGSLRDRANEALDRVLGRDVYAFQYKDKGRPTTGDYQTVYHGVMAEEYPEVMHHGGRIFSPVSAFGELVLAVQALAQKLDALEGKTA